MDIATISTIIGTGIAVSAFIYGFLRNFKTDLRNEIREMKTDLRSEMNGMKTDLRSEMNGMKNELKNEMSEMKTELKNEMKEMKTELKNEMKEMKIEIKETNRKIDKLDEKVTDIDRRLCRLEGAFSSKDCCMIKEERHLKQAE